MFLLTFLVVNMADTKRKLENDVFAEAGISQKNNCALTRLDYQQEAGLMSSVPLGENLIPIQRGLDVYKRQSRTWLTSCLNVWKKKTRSILLSGNTRNSC